MKLSEQKHLQADNFVNLVQVQFEKDPEKYNQFLDIMLDLKKYLITPDEAVQRVATLFSGYPHLANEFNAFIPPTHRLPSTPPPSVENDTPSPPPLHHRNVRRS